MDSFTRLYFSEDMGGLGHLIGIASSLLRCLKDRSVIAVGSNMSMQTEEVRRRQWLTLTFGPQTWLTDVTIAGFRYWSTMWRVWRSSATDGSTRHLSLQVHVLLSILDVLNTLTHHLLHSHRVMAPLSQASLVR